MTSTVYYFSGTGNSFVVARDIANGIGGKLVPIPTVIYEDRVSPDSDTIGIVFPAYYVPFGGLPQMVKRFVGKLHGLESKYIFGVCTYGSAEAGTLAVLGRMLKSRGGKLAGKVAVNMPENIYPDLAAGKHRIMFDVWKRRADSVCRLILGRRRVNISLPNALVGIAYPLANLIGVPVKALFKKHTLRSLQEGAASSLPTYDQVLPLMDTSFSAGGKCVGCRTCSKVCPAGNIKIEDRKPSWGHNCEYCLACYNWCPNQAIEGRALKSTLKYHHPDAKVSDMILRG